MPKFFFAKFPRFPILPFAPGTLNKHMRTMDRIEMALIIMLVIMWTSLVLMGCGLTGPAKQQKISTPPSQSTTSITIAELDTNRDGVLDSQEQAQLHMPPPHQHTLITFVCIMGLVIVVSVACGLISRRIKRVDQSDGSDGSDVAQPAVEPAAPARELLQEQAESERLRRPRPEDEQFQI